MSRHLCTRFGSPEFSKLTKAFSRATSETENRAEDFEAPYISQEVAGLDPAKTYIVGFYYAAGASFNLPEGSSCNMQLLVNGEALVSPGGIPNTAKKGEWMYSKRSFKVQEWATGPVSTISVRVGCDNSDDPVNVILDGFSLGEACAA